MTEPRRPAAASGRSAVASRFRASAAEPDYPVATGRGQIPLVAAFDNRQAHRHADAEAVLTNTPARPSPLDSSGGERRR